MSASDIWEEIRIQNTFTSFQEMMGECWDACEERRTKKMLQAEASDTNGESMPWSVEFISLRRE